MKNKLSIWSTIILVATIISLILLVTSAIVLFVGLPASIEAAKQAATAANPEFTPAEIDLAVNVAITAIIVVFVLSCVFDIFKIVGGFLFSLKNKWGIFCIVVSILSTVSGTYGLINDISNKAGVATIIISIISLLINVLLVVACFKHKAEIQ